MTNITPVVEFAIAVAFLAISYFVIPAVKNSSSKAQIATTIQIVDAVVRSARELDITRELEKLGKDKVQYAWDQAKAALAARKITISDEELKAYIKAAVTNLRIEINKATESLSISPTTTATAETDNTTTAGGDAK